MYFVYFLQISYHCPLRNSPCVGCARPRETWLDDYCAQLSLLATQIIWTEDSWIMGGKNDDTDGIVGIVVREFLFDSKSNPLETLYKVFGSLNQVM